MNTGYKNPHIKRKENIQKILDEPRRKIKEQLQRIDDAEIKYPNSSEDFLEKFKHIHWFTKEESDSIKKNIYSITQILKGKKEIKKERKNQIRNENRRLLLLMLNEPSGGGIHHIYRKKFQIDELWFFPTDLYDYRGGKRIDKQHISNFTRQFEYIIETQIIDIINIKKKSPATYVRRIKGDKGVFITLWMAFFYSGKLRDFKQTKYYQKYISFASHLINIDYFSLWQSPQRKADKKIISKIEFERKYNTRLSDLGYFELEILDYPELFEMALTDTQQFYDLQQRLVAHIRPAVDDKSYNAYSALHSYLLSVGCYSRYEALLKDYNSFIADNDLKQMNEENFKESIESEEPKKTKKYPILIKFLQDHPNTTKESFQEDIEAHLSQQGIMMAIHLKKLSKSF